MSVARFKLSIKGIWVKCSTTVPVWHNHATPEGFCHILLSHSFTGIQTHNLRIMSQIFYHYATGYWSSIYFDMKSWTLFPTLCQWWVLNPQSWDYELILRPMCYPGTIMSDMKSWTRFLLVPMVGFKPTILGLWIECSTTMPQEHNHLWYFLSLGANGGFQTLCFRIMSWVFYRCARWGSTTH